jgi:hypothetical protein
VRGFAAARPRRASATFAGGNLILLAPEMMVMTNGKNPAAALRFAALGAIGGAALMLLLWLPFWWAAVPASTGFHGEAAWEHSFLTIVTSGCVLLTLVVAHLALARSFLSEARAAAVRGYL